MHPQTQFPQLPILPALALPPAPQASQEHLLQTSRSSYRASTRWESKTIYQTDSLAWLRCCCRRCQLISKLSPLLYLCSAISFYLISLFSPFFYLFFFPYCIFFPYVSLGEILGLDRYALQGEWERWERRGKTEAHSLWLYDL